VSIEKAFAIKASPREIYAALERDLEGAAEHAGDTFEVLRREPGRALDLRVTIGGVPCWLNYRLEPKEGHTEVSAVLTPFGLSRNDRYACAIHLDVHERYLRLLDLRQSQLNRLCHMSLLTVSYIFTDGLGLALDGLGGDFQACQLLQLLPSLVERSFRSHNRHHPPYSRRVCRAFDIQFPIARTLTGMTVRADVIRTLDSNPSQRGDQLF